MRGDLVEQLFDASQRRRLEAILDVDLAHPVQSLDEVPPGELAAVEVLITGWGVPLIGVAELDRMPSLGAVVHSGGTVKEFLAPEAWDRDIVVTTAALANSYPVAEYTLAMILLAGKGVIDIGLAYRDGPSIYGVTPPDIGNYRRTIGILGASRVGRRVLDLLRPFDFEVLVHDPLVASDDPILDRAELVGLDDLFRRSTIVSVHAPLLPETVGMVGRRQLGLLPPGSTVINTARAPVVDQVALAEAVELQGLRAILDVTDPEPLGVDHPLRQLPGVVITPHVAGALGNELGRLGECAVHEVEHLAAGREPEHRLAKDALVAVA